MINTYTTAIYFLFFIVCSNSSFSTTPDFLVNTERWFVFLFISNNIDESEKGAIDILRRLYYDFEEPENIIHGLDKTDYSTDTTKDKGKGKKKTDTEIENDLNSTFIEEYGSANAYIAGSIDFLLDNTKDANDALLLFLFKDKNKSYSPQRNLSYVKVLQSNIKKAEEKKQKKKQI